MRRIAAPMFKKLSLELGGKNPNIIFADCDWEKMMKTTIQSSLQPGTDMFVRTGYWWKKVFMKNLKKNLLKQIKNLTVGDPMEETSKQGAIVSKGHFDKVMKCN